MTSFFKCYESVVRSSLWSEDSDTIKVFFTMLATSDERGYLEASLPGLVRVAELPRERVEAALVVLQQPDPESKSKAYDGRRVVKVEGGWLVVNKRKYWERGTSTERVRVHRAKTSGVPETDVTDETNTLFSSSSVPTTEKRRGKRDVTHVTDVTLEAGELVSRIRELKSSNYAPGGSLTTIPKAEVEKLGPDVLRAFLAVGGPQRFLAATGKDIAFLNREFGKALVSARSAASP